MSAADTGLLRKIRVTFDVEVPIDLPAAEIHRMVGAAYVQLDEPGNEDGGDADFRTGQVTSNWEELEVTLYEGWIYCVCGNDPASAGWSAVAPDGTVTDGPEPGWEGELVCRDCGIVVRQPDELQDGVLPVLRRLAVWQS
jgi:hypothetical protein